MVEGMSFEEATEALREAAAELYACGDPAYGVTGKSSKRAHDAALLAVIEERDRLRRALETAVVELEYGLQGKPLAEHAKTAVRLGREAGAFAQRCEGCGGTRYTEPTEHVPQGEVDRPGWKCSACHWWNWLDRAPLLRRWEAL